MDGRIVVCGILLVCASLGLFLSGRTQDASPAVVPSRILLNLPADAARTATITWRTDQPADKAIIQYCEASADPRFVNSALSETGTTQTVERDQGTVYYHTANLRDLTPSTRYSYRVGDGSTWSEWLDFTTASEEPSPFSFIYFGDAQNNVKSMWSRVVREANVTLPRAAFMLHAGDLINIADADREWDEWFQAGGWLHATIPTVATPGNHEYKSGQLSRYWRPQFEFPRNGVSGLEDTNYYIDYQGVRIISLNTLEKIEEQAIWLDTALWSSNARWNILTFHHPVYSTAKGRDNAKIREAWLPVILKHKVDLVLQGHDHSYGRKNVPHGASLRHESTLFVVSVSGPKMYALGETVTSEMNSSAENTQLFQVISIDGDKLNFRAYKATGELYDECTLFKDSDVYGKSPDGKRVGAQLLRGTK